MTKWELKTIYATVHQVPWEIQVTKDKKTGKTDWDDIKALASDGWELVSVTTFTKEGFNNDYYLIYTFKRPLI